MKLLLRINLMPQDKDKKEDKFSSLSLALKNNLLRRKSKNKLVANQKTQDN